MLENSAVVSNIQAIERLIAFSFYFLLLVVYCRK